jgi:hypothetical protein
MTAVHHHIDSKSSICRDQLLTVGDLETFKTDLLTEIAGIVKNTSGQTTKRWLKAAEVRKLLGLSPNTLKNLRNNGTLPYTQLGGVFYFDYNDLQKVFEELKTAHNGRKS